nr:hypothetical protein [Nonlabens ulvanivorans]
MMHLVFLANSLKWRVPSSDKEFSKWKNKLSFNSLGIGFDVENKLNNEELEDFKKNIKTDISNEFKKMLIAMQPVRFEHVRKEISKGLFLLRTEVGHSVLGDNPIIELHPDTEEFIEDFIFPFSELDSLIFKKGSKRNNVNEYFYTFKDVAQFHLAENYVICKDKEYLESILDYYDKIIKNGKEKSIIKGLFQTVE